MSFKRRIGIAAVCLGVGLALQLALQYHVSGGEGAAFPRIGGRLADLPMTLASPHPGGANRQLVWKGQDNPHMAELRKQLDFEYDDLFSRYYLQPDTGTLLNLYLVHSVRGEDRKHHPEVCVRDVAGAPEDVEARSVIYLDGEKKRPVQRLRFLTGTQQYTMIYYWHYTFEAPVSERQSFLQMLHQRLSRTPPSVTAQVSTTAPLKSCEEWIEKSFLGEVDVQLQRTHLPAGARMGCERLNIALVRE